MIAAPTVEQPTIRRIPAPSSDPPFDDEHRHQAAADGQIQGALALAFALPGGVPAVPEPPPHLRLVPIAPVSDAPRQRRHKLDADSEPRRTGRAALPDPAGWSATFTQAVIEVIAGRRPAGQLVRWTSAEVYESIQHRARAWRLRGSDRRTHAALRSVRVSEPADGIAEVCALVQVGRRARALALRLEGLDGRWQCTVLQVI